MEQSQKILLRATGLSFLIVTGLMGCNKESPNSGNTEDDAGNVICGREVAEPNHECLAANPCGNSIGVGQTCSRGGGECGAFIGVEGAVRFCTVDLQPSTLRYFCTKAYCDFHEECGENAWCTSPAAEPGKTVACIPANCWEQEWDPPEPDDRDAFWEARGGFVDPGTTQ